MSVLNAECSLKMCVKAEVAHCTSRSTRNGVRENLPTTRTISFGNHRSARENNTQKAVYIRKDAELHTSHEENINLSPRLMAVCVRECLNAH